MSANGCMAFYISLICVLTTYIDSQPSNSSDNVVEPSNSSDNVVEPSNSSDNVVEPSNILSSDNVVEPSNSSDDVVEPSNSSDNVVEPSNSSDNVVEPSNSSDNVVEPSNSIDNVVEPSNSSVVDMHLYYRDFRFVEAFEQGLQVCPQSVPCGGLTQYLEAETSAVEWSIMQLEKYQDLLKRNNLPNNETYCCLPCSCSYECKRDKTCCDDASIKWFNISGNVGAGEYYIPETDYFYGRYPYFMSPAQMMEANKVPNLRYKTVSYCQDSSHCIRDFHPLEGKIHVASSKRLYINRRCAECNKEYNTTRWRLTAGLCKEALYSLDFHSVSDTVLIWYLNFRCALLAEPPSETNVLPIVYQRLNTINLCNQTGLWEVKNALIKRLCENSVKFTQTVLPVIDEHMFYANQYCFICNNPEGSLPKPCDIPLKDMYDREWGIFHEELGPVYDVQLSSPFYIHGHDYGETNNEIWCPGNEIHDPIFMICRQFACPFAYRPRNKTCVEPLIKARNRLYTIQTKMNLTGDIQFQELEMEKHRFAQELLTFLDNNQTCSPHEVFFRLSFRGFCQLVVIMYLNATEACDDKAIGYLITNLHLVSVPFTFDAYAVVPSMYFGTDTNMPSLHVTANVVVLKMPYLFCQHIILHSTLSEICSLLRINTSDCSLINITYLSNEYNVYFDEENKLFYACTNDYIGLQNLTIPSQEQLPEQTNNSQGLKMSWILLTIVIVMVSSSIKSRIANVLFKLH